ncbi:AGE family epimerase/isomerase [Rhodobacterales bacterium]|nr:AGE family epimerase/isomerase [Rhodobacterales bacterium]
MRASDKVTGTQGLQSLSSDLTDWLTNRALPIWQSAGADLETGECFEAIDLTTCEPVADDRRSRVAPRQIYSFLAGARLGWDGPATELASRMYDWYWRTYLSNAGYIASSADRSNRVTDNTFDLYNQAFALFGCSQIAAHVPDLRPDATERATNLLNYLIDHYKHPEAGFREANPDKAPLCSNPHMHLFEACLAWETVCEDPVWSELADEIAELALTRFIDPVNGGLREFFDLDWSPMPGDRGRVVEPGHQFEWAWLLCRWGRLRNDAGALVAARRLYDIGWTYGIDETRGVAFMALNDDFTVRDPLARLWGQTEWIKAALALAEASTEVEKSAYLSDVPDAVRALRLYFEDVPEGLWKDKLQPDGTFATGPAPASSFYHIVCAIEELHTFTAAG